MKTPDEALAEFTVEALEEATEILRHGDAGTKLALIKMVVTGAIKSKETDNEGEIERLKAEARKLLGKTLEAPDG